MRWNLNRIDDELRRGVELSENHKKNLMKLDNMYTRQSAHTLDFSSIHRWLHSAGIITWKSSANKPQQALKFTHKVTSESPSSRTWWAREVWYVSLKRLFSLPPPTQNVDDAITSFFRMLSARRLARNWTEKSSTREKRSSVLNVKIQIFPKFFLSFASLSLALALIHMLSSSYFHSVAVAAHRCARWTMEKVTFWYSLWVMNSFNDPHQHSSSFSRDKFVSESNV